MMIIDENNKAYTYNITGVVGASLHAYYIRML